MLSNTQFHILFSIEHNLIFQTENEWYAEKTMMTYFSESKGP